MKIYVASSFEQREETKDAHTALLEAGHEITLDWTTHRWLKDSPEAEGLYKEYALSDVQGVLDADVYILLLGSRASTGAHIELGIALGSNKKHILIVGDIQQFTLFYRHPKITHLPTIKDAIEHIGSIDA